MALLICCASPTLADIKPIPLSPTAVASGAQITYDKGIEFVTIGSPGNAAWPGNGASGDRAIGRGSVGYEYKIGRFEVTTSQWVDFFNAAYDRPSTEWLPYLSPPGHWGAVPVTPNTATGRRWAVPAGNEMIPVGNISWRMAAMYCNWLTNDQSSDRSAFLNGSYDVSTFGYTGTVFTDQQAHSPGAKYWIPTWDEWLKAAHYDPNKPGAAQGGSGVPKWNFYSTGSDVGPYYGPPGVRVKDGIPGPDPNGPLADANAEWNSQNFPGYNPYVIPLGAYPMVQSAWGLLDTAGGTSEWTEQVLLTNGRFPTARVFEGSAWDASVALLADQIGGRSGDFPSLSSSDLGFRVASSVPAPGVSVLATIAGFWYAQRTRKGVPHAQVPTRLGLCPDRLDPRARPKPCR